MGPPHGAAADPTARPGAPAPGRGNPTRTVTIPTVTPGDPNDIYGPAGAGAERWVARDSVLGYTIRFENVGPGSDPIPPGQEPATAPAIDVRVSETLDPDVDLDTFALGSLGWGAVTVPVPDGATAFATRIGDDPGEPLTPTGEYVDVSAALDRDTRIVTWRLVAIDPATGLPTRNPLGGFLPPEDGHGVGQGFVGYRAQVRSDTAAGTDVTAQARIVFDTEAPIDTPVWSNRIDVAAPAVTVTSMPATSPPGPLTFAWSATDDGSGAATYDVYLSTDGGALALVAGATPDASFAVVGVTGHRYGVAVRATDAVGHTSPTPTAAATTTAVVSGAPVANPDPATTGAGVAVVIDVLANDTDPEGEPLTLAAVGTPQHGTAVIDAGKVRYTPAAGFSGTDTFTYTVADAFGTTAAGTVTVAVAAPPGPACTITGTPRVRPPPRNVACRRDLRLGRQRRHLRARRRRRPHRRRRQRRPLRRRRP